MGCKHRELIAVQDNGKQEFYCKVFDRRISDYECRNCMMKIEENDMNELLNIFFGGGFNKGN